jgi:mRNA-degrading endonuclease RelE of RelBE toxin-antitoxin system
MNVITLDYFERRAKKLIRKYPSLSQEIATLIADLANNPTQGVYLSLDCYKIRLKIASKGKGKSGGARVITCVKVEQDTVTLLTIYDKSEQEDISENFLVEILEEYDLL